MERDDESYRHEPNQLPGEVVTKAIEVAQSAIARGSTTAPEYARQLGDFVNLLLGRVYNGRVIDVCTHADRGE